VIGGSELINFQRIGGSFAGSRRERAPLRKDNAAERRSVPPWSGVGPQ
jgi:hypothetical protein